MAIGNAGECRANELVVELENDFLFGLGVVAGSDSVAHQIVKLFTSLPLTLERSTRVELGQGALILEQERVLQFDSFNVNDAWAVGSRLVELGTARKHPIAVSITFGHQRVFHAALPGARADNDAWLENKYPGGAVLRHFLLCRGHAHRADSRDFRTASNLDLCTHAVHRGALPLRCGARLSASSASAGGPSALTTTLSSRLSRNTAALAADRQPVDQQHPCSGCESLDRSPDLLPLEYP